MTKRELHEAVNAEMVAAANKVAELKAKLEEITKDLGYWQRQEEAARIVSIRLDMEAARECSNSEITAKGPGHQ